ncbi:MAG: hypothetical protein AMXMBFR84_46480 [Candidatus Hydrogenedentota bacterium]
MQAIGAFAQKEPAESLALMKPAEGLEVTLFASEPDLYNPTMIDVDAYGRVWVCEAVNYRLFNQPITSDKGDRIRVLEDTNYDGICDKATTFYQDPTLQAPMGIAVLGDRVYVCQSPDLFYLRDTDGDGVADERKVILTGFDGVDHDHAIHGVSFGPDGLLYFSVGDRGLNVTDSLGNNVHAGQNAPVQAATILRTDLEGKRIELLAQNMRNPYEPVVNPWGTVFISDNDDDGNEQTRINYIMEGGNYGYWPRRKGDRRLDAVHWNEDRPGTVPKMVRTGFGSPCGLMYYEGALLPEKWRNTLIHAEAGPGVVRSYPYKALGAGFSSEIDVMLSCPDDSWFRPVDVCAAPDGSIFVADWYDPGVGGHRMADVIKGRIYRIAPKGSRYSTRPFDINSFKDGLDVFSSPNQARRYLAYKKFEDSMAKGDTTVLEKAHGSRNMAVKARGLWLFSRYGERGKKALLDASKHEDVRLRTESVRILASRELNALHEAPWLLDDADPAVRRQVLVELARMEDKAPWTFEWALALAEKYDGEDRFYREALGLAFKGREAEAYTVLIEGLGTVWDSRSAGITVQLHPVEALPRAVAAAQDASLPIELRKLALQAIDAIGTEAAGEALFAAAGDPALQGQALWLLGFDEGSNWQTTLVKPELDVVLKTALESNANRQAAWDFVLSTKRPGYLSLFLEAATQAGGDLPTRLRALEAVQRVAAQEGLALEAVVPLLNDPEEKVQSAAVNLMHALNTNESRSAIQAVLIDTSKPVGVRRSGVRALSGNKSGSLLLLDLAEQGQLPQDLVIDVREATHSSPFEDIRLMAEQILPREVTAEGQVLPPLKELTAMAGNPEQGRSVFFDAEKAQCNRCHRIGEEGTEVGPNLTLIGQKLGKDGLFESILNPSAAVSHEYVVWLFETEVDGYLSGFIRSETPESIQLVDAAGAVTSINPATVIDRRQTNTSLMPTGLPATMSAQDLVNLVAYLSTLK